MDAQTNTVMMKALTFKKMGVLNEKRCKNLFKTPITNKIENNLNLLLIVIQKWKVIC